MNTMIQDTIEREMVLRAPKERVYNAITQPEQIVKWFPEGIEGKLIAGERPVFDFGEYGKFSIYVEASDPHDYFAYRWVSGSQFVPGGFIGDPLKMPNTLVEFRLEDAPEGTLLKLKESGFASLPAEYMEQALKDNNGGWDFMLERLQKLMTQA
jgi:uncharacterized protein YndB with AHSA1/START domain